MPALQVRDFPDELYEQLKAYAASQHRSVAQQTIVAVEQMLADANASHYWDGKTLHYPAPRPRIFSYDTEAERNARIEKRKELFARLERIEWKGPKPTADEIVAMVRGGHEERDQRILESAGFHREMPSETEAMA